jgi:small subunit ribosomal protein S6
MPKYEAVVIADNLLTEEEVKSLQDRIRDIIQKDGGEITRMDFWGKKRLAFDIKKKREGYYTLFYFTAPNSSRILTELERFCQIEEKVLRHMVCHEVPSQYAKSAPGEKPAAPQASEKEGIEQEKPAVEEKVATVEATDSSESAETKTPEGSDTAPEEISSEPVKEESGN